jgi:hypothetical protein
MVSPGIPIHLLAPTQRLLFPQYMALFCYDGVLHVSIIIPRETISMSYQHCSGSHCNYSSPEDCGVKPCSSCKRYRLADTVVRVVNVILTLNIDPFSPILSRHFAETESTRSHLRKYVPSLQ